MSCTRLNTVNKRISELEHDVEEFTQNVAREVKNMKVNIEGRLRDSNLCPKETLGQIRVVQKQYLMRK